MDSPLSDAPVVEEAPQRARKKVQLVSLEGGPAPAPKKRAPRKKLTVEESEPAQIAFKSTKGDVSFSARKRAAKQVEIAEVPPTVEAPSNVASPPPPPLARQQGKVKAPPTPGLYDMLHEHLSARGAERSQRWSQFLVA